jgi:hypothetical protein
MTRALEQPRSIAFRRTDGRQYAITITRTLYHPFALVIARGGAKSGMRERTEEFVTREQLTSRWRALVALRRRHRYEEIPHA